ncbi:MAG: hypothetical protein ACI9S9_001908 [Planctomycetota bacterium]|jgi:hypothetical protein
MSLNDLSRRCLAVLLSMQLAPAQDVLIEAEGFDTYGGWLIDTQFIDRMGSPYLLAHGMGHSVADAEMAVKFPETGKYSVFVRTVDWVAKFGAQGSPGRFQVLVDGEPLNATFGTEGSDWQWQLGGEVEITSREVLVTLHDLTGYEGRCDAILFTKSERRPSNDHGVLAPWRKALLGHSQDAIEKGGYDLVVLGGGFSGLGCAISAARMGCRVALIQNRPVLGGNASSEVRVWANGGTRLGKYPNIGDIIEEFTDHALLSPGPADIYVDQRKVDVVSAEKNIDLFLEHHAFAVEAEGDRIQAVRVLDVRTSKEKRFVAPYFADCTGHGSIGALAGADFDMTMKDHMGMTNHWRWEFTDSPKDFAPVPWALDLDEGEFPYPRTVAIKPGGRPDAMSNAWYWETGFDKHPIDDLEYMRDTNLRAMYGAMNALKNKGVYAKKDPSGQRHATAQLIWSGHIGGPRESRRLMGDLVLNKEHIVSYAVFPDGCVPTTWSIDLHHPKQQYLGKYGDNPFISYATFEHRSLASKPYLVPYRCFYSRNVENLFMAGRCASVTHEGLGTVRVMKTCGMMGEVVGKAVSLCVLHSCDPRAIYTDHLAELLELLKLPGRAHRETISAGFVIPPAPPIPPPVNPSHVGTDPSKLAGIVVDDSKAIVEGVWKSSTFELDFVGTHYLHDERTGKGKKSVRWEFEVPVSGLYEVRLSYTHSSSRDAYIPVMIDGKGGVRQVHIDQQVPPPHPGGFASVGVFEFEAGQPSAVVISNKGTTGHVIADAVQLLRHDE